MSPMGQGINIGGIYADLEINSGKLEQGLAGARKALDIVAQEVKRLDEDMNRGSITVADYNARMAELANTEQTLISKMQAAYTAVSTANGGLNVAAAGMGKLGAASRQTAQAMMQFGYMVDDIQYGFGSIINNIAPLAYGLSGGNTSVAAASQIAAVAVYQLARHFDDLMETLGVEYLRTEAEQMEELANKTHRTADEQERLNAFKREQREIDKMLAERTSEEDKDAKATGKAIKEGVPSELEQAVMNARQELGQQVKVSPEDRKKLQDTMERDQFMGAFSSFGNFLKYFMEQAGLKPADETLDQKAEAFKQSKEKEAADELLHAAQEPGPAGDPARKQLIALAEAAYDKAKKEGKPAPFPPGFLKDLIDSLPENRRQQEEWEAQGKANIKKMKENADKAKKAEHDFHANLHKPELQIGEGGDAAAGAPGKAFDKIDRAKQRDIHQENARFQRDFADLKKHSDIDERAEQLVMGDMAMGAMGVPHASALDLVREELKRRGVPKDQQEKMAQTLVRDAHGNVMGKLANQHGDDHHQSRNSEVFATADLAHRVQSAVGKDDWPKKAHDQRSQMLKLLADIAKQGGGLQIEGLEGT